MKLKKMIKTISNVSALGTAVMKFGSKALDTADRIIHREEYEKARKRALACKIVLGAAAGIMLVLVFPYKVVIEKNGDFEIRSLLLRIFRKSESPVSSEDGEGCDLPGIEEDFADCTVIESVDED